MIAVVIAAFSALMWGSADYCGGRASQRADALPVTAVSQVYGLPVLLIALLLVPGVFHVTDVAWGAGAGVCGFFGIVLLYRSLSAGSMAIVAPITAVTGAVVPMGVGLGLGERPSALALAGAGCAVIAIGLVSMGAGPTGTGVSRSVVLMALSAGTLFGGFFVLLAQTHDDSGMWAFLSVRGASIPLGLALVALRGQSLRLPRRVHGWVFAAGVGDIGANALFLLASREGLLSVVAPLAALYPVSTVLLALALDKERLRSIQVVGLGLAATALVLTAV